jgi:hypothetical protein
MVSSRDSRIIDLWLERQASPHTRGCRTTRRRDNETRQDHSADGHNGLFAYRCLPESERDPGGCGCHSVLLDHSNHDFRLLMHRRVQSLSPCDASEGERQRNKIVVRNRGNDDIELI